MVTKLWRATAGAEYGLPGRFFSKVLIFGPRMLFFRRGKQVSRPAEARLSARMGTVFGKDL
jgi:hypothetical protein